MLLAHLLEDLPSELERLDCILSHPDVVVTGYNSGGERCRSREKPFERSAIEVDREREHPTLGATTSVGRPC